jgi:2-polyprenyl-3-methyl-5-hydroxy-6-metoxy-1,4-benzoquinol methylase
MGSVIRGRYPGATVVSLDYRHSHLRLGPGARVAADAFKLPFRPQSFDFVLCSLFLHHFSDAGAVELIRSMRQVASRAVIILDLERHLLAYYFLPATRRLLRWSPMTVHDGVISVGAAFRPEEIRALARAAGAASAEVRTHWPWFRLSAIIPAEEKSVDLRQRDHQGVAT